MEQLAAAAGGGGLVICGRLPSDELLGELLESRACWVSKGSLRWALGVAPVNVLAPVFTRAGRARR